MDGVVRRWGLLVRVISNGAMPRSDRRDKRNRSLFGSHPTKHHSRHAWAKGTLARPDSQSPELQCCRMSGGGGSQTCKDKRKRVFDLRPISSAVRPHSNYETLPKLINCPSLAFHIQVGLARIQVLRSESGERCWTDKTGLFRWTIAQRSCMAPV